MRKLKKKIHRENLNHPTKEKNPAALPKKKKKKSEPMKSLC